MPDTKSDTKRKRGHTRTVTLTSGGTLTLSMSVDVTQLQESDRTFIFEIVDRINEYVKENPPAKV